MNSKKSIALFVSGDGWLAKKIHQSKLLTDISTLDMVFTDGEEGAYEYFRQQPGVEVHSFDFNMQPSTNSKICELIKNSNVEYAYLNFTNKIDRLILEQFNGKMFNFHMSLLPLHTGLKAIELSYASKELFYGATFHQATEKIDDGPILGQLIIAKSPGKSEMEYNLDLLKQAELFFVDMIKKTLTREIKSVDGKLFFQDAEYGQLPFNPKLDN